MEKLTTEQKCRLLYEFFRNRRGLAIDKECKEYRVPKYVSIDFTTQDNEQVRLTTVHFSDDTGFLLPEECVPGTEITDEEYDRIVDALLSSIRDNSYIRGMEKSKDTSTRFRDLKSTTKVNIGVAVLLVALFSGVFFLINENVRLRHELHDTQAALESVTPAPAPAQAPDSTSVD